MDPLLLEALRFGIAIVAGGLVAVIAQRIAFRHAQQLATEDRQERRRSTLRARAQEVEENMERCGTEDRTHAPSRISQSAWQTARGLDLPAEVLTALRRAYALGEDLNSRIGIVDSYAASPIVGEAGANAEQVRSRYLNNAIDASHAIAAKAHRAFEAARKALKPVA
jgi:hypothetical protein